MHKGMERFLGTEQTRVFLGKLACDGYSDDIAVVMSTSYPDDAEMGRSLAQEHGFEKGILVLEYDDVENAQRPTAFTEELAQQVISFVKEAWGSGKDLLFVCDGARSRSAALMCAVMRVFGFDDISIWTQPERYAPNTLIYQLVLEAGGIHLDDSQVLACEHLKEMGMFCKIRKGTMHVMRVDEPMFRKAASGDIGCVLRTRDGPDAVVGDAIAFIMEGDFSKVVVVEVTE